VAENLNILNTAVSLLIRAILLAVASRDACVSDTSTNCFQPAEPRFQ